MLSGDRVVAAGGRAPKACRPPRAVSLPWAMSPVGAFAGTVTLPSSASPTLGDVLAEAAIHPDEDVQMYMQKFLLPALTPALEALLHVVSERGELPPEEKEKDKKDEKRGGSGAAGGEEKKSEEKKPKKKSKKLQEAQEDEDGAPESEGGGEEGSQAEKFNPLLWLSEKLRESATGRRYKEQFEERMEELRRKREEEAEAAKKAAEEAEAAAAAAMAESTEPAGEVSASTEA